MDTDRQTSTSDTKRPASATMRAATTKRRGTAALIATLFALLAAMFVTAGPPASAAGPPGEPTTLVPEIDGRTIKGRAVSPDGRFVVFVSDRIVAERYELWSVPVEGGEPNRLSGDFVDGGELATFRITPDSSHVVFAGDIRQDGRTELFAVPIAGGEIGLLTSIAHGDVRTDIQIAPDSSRVVYRANHLGETDTDLYSAPIGPTASPTRLNDFLPPNRTVRPGFAISPTTNQVVFLADQDEANTYQVYSSALAGGGATRISSNQDELLAIWHRSVSELKIASGGLDVVFRARQPSNVGEALYVIPIDGGINPRRLSGTLPVGGSVLRYAISPDGRRVAYIADQTTLGTNELYSVHITGGASSRLNRSLAPGGQVLDVTPQFTPNNAHVIYSADGDTPGTLELYAADAAGGDARRLNPPLPAGGTVSPEPTISLDSTRVIYRRDIGGKTELLSVPTTGGASTLVSPPAHGAASVSPFNRVTPDGAWIVFTTDDQGPGIFHAFAASVRGGPAVRLNGPLPTGYRVFGPMVADVDTVVLPINSDNFDTVALVAVDVAHRCDGRQATITGTPGDDVIEGTPGPDVIVGLEGDDVIRGLGGNDVICGNQGDDDIRGGGGADRIFGQRGRDTIRGGSSGDYISGGSGGDDLRGNSGKDTIEGRTGNDRIDGGKAGDTISGNGGNDIIDGGSGHDEISGGKKGDVIEGGKGNDVIRGNSGHDNLDGGTGTDICSGGPGNDSATGCETATSIVGSPID